MPASALRILLSDWELVVSGHSFNDRPMMQLQFICQTSTVHVLRHPPITYLKYEVFKIICAGVLVLFDNFKLL